MGDKRELSLRLYSVLEHVGASEDLRKLHQDTAVTADILSTVESSVACDFLVSKYNCGSSYEGSVTPDLASDKDIIHCFRDIYVVPDIQSSPPGWSYLIVRDAWTYPGHVKLQCVLNGHPQVVGDEMLPDTDIDWEGRMCCKHFNNMRGPAEKQVNEDGVHYLDQVFARKCQSIPPYALEWYMRERPYGWPSQDQLHDMTRMGCMFVGAGFVYSGERAIEWRLSFTLQERRLMSELSHVQHKVFVLLKLIKRNILGEMFDDETLTSYHCKTCILFAVQMNPASAWTEENLINCLLQCLNLLIRWTEQGNCPNYFIKDQNLFMKEGFRNLRRRLLYVLRLMIEADTSFLYMIQSDNIADLLRNGGMRRYHEITIMKRNTLVCHLQSILVKFIMTRPLTIIHILSRGCHDPVSIARALDALRRLETVNDHSMEVTQSSLAYLYPFFHLHIANALVSLAYRYPDIVDHQRLVETVDFHFREAYGLDLVNERLARATVLYKSEHYDECFLLLQQIEQDFDKHVILYCPVTGHNTVLCRDLQDEKEQLRKLADMSIGEYIKSSTATSVMFLPSEMEIVPVPLHLEMMRSVGTLPGSRDEVYDCWFDWAVVDPKIYLYFMQYLVTCELHKEAHKQVAMDNLQAEIDIDNGYLRAGRKSRLGHKETAYNLLGWIYMQENLFAEALLCFTESWKERPFHNAAKFYMCNLAAKLTNRE